jgi:PTS system nitrogen regulatory IIA component
MTAAMLISEVLSPERTQVGVTASGKAGALAALATLIAGAAPGLSARQILDAFLQREREGSTGFGGGVALPHGRLKSCHKAVGACVRLAGAVDYDALDREPVQLLFALLVPETAAREHLELMARLAGKFSDETLLRQLKSEPTSDKIYAILTN